MMKSHSHSKHHGKHHIVVHAHKSGGAAKRASGGRTELKAAGNPDVFKEAEGEESYSRKRGGRARKSGGKVVERMTGGAVRPRLDRPGRKRGGRVGSDMSPLTSAHAGHHGSPEMPKEQDGGMSD
jgi:hypothetical protein